MGWRARIRAVIAVGTLATMGAACTFDLAGLGSAPSEDAPDAATSAEDATTARIEDARLPIAANDVAEAALQASVIDAGQDVALAFDAHESAVPVSLRYNLAGPAFVSTSPAAAGTWRADPGTGGVCGPSVFSVSTVYGTADGPLYVAEVFGNPLVCGIGAGQLADGNYDVTLYFAEIYFGPGCPGGGTGAGSRVFNVSLEGTQVETNLDLYALGHCLAAANGTGSPVIRTHRVAIHDGTLNVSMSASKDNAKLSAIRVDGPV